MPLSLFWWVFADEDPYYDLVAILVSQSIYNDIDEEIKRYWNDIQAVLPNTKALIIPTPDDVSVFQLASLLEWLYYQGHQNISPNVNYDSQLVGTVLVGDIPLPSVYNGTTFSQTMLPYVDFKDKVYIYNRDLQRYVFSENNQNGISAEVWHGVISPASWDNVQDSKVDALKQYFDKNHDFYQWQWLFEAQKGIVNADPDAKVLDAYEPSILYYDQFVEQKSIHREKYLWYLAWLQNREDISYSRFTKKLATRINDMIYGEQDAEITQLLEKVAPDLAAQAVASWSNSITQSLSSDIQSLPVIMEGIKKYYEIFSGTTLSNLRKGWFFSGRYGTDSAHVQVDTLPKLVTLMDEASLATIHAANNDLEKYIDTLVSTSWWEASLVPVSYTQTAWSNSNNGSSSCNTRVYTHFSYGKKWADITSLDDCSVYRGSTWNFRPDTDDGYSFQGQVVEANRWRNVAHAASDAAICGPELRVTSAWITGGISGYWWWNTPLNWTTQQTNQTIGLWEYDINGSIVPVYDIVWSQAVSAAQIDARAYSLYGNSWDNTKLWSSASAWNPNIFSSCSVPSYVLTYGGKYHSYSNSDDGISCDGSDSSDTSNVTLSENFSCDTQHDVVRSYNNQSFPIGPQNCASFNPWSCHKVVCSVQGQWIVYQNSVDESSCINEETGVSLLVTHSFVWKPIADIGREYKSPTPQEIAAQSKSQITPSLPIDSERYVEFQGKWSVANRRIFYPNYFRAADLYLDSGESAYIDRETVYNQALVQYNADMSAHINSVLAPIGWVESIDLQALMTDPNSPLLSQTSYSSLWENKQISFDDSLANALYWYQLGSIWNKYRYIFEHYLNDQFDGYVNSDGALNTSLADFVLPENKKLYEIVYLNAPGDGKNMFVGFSPEESLHNPYVTEIQQIQELKTTLVAANIEQAQALPQVLESCVPQAGTSSSNFIAPIGCPVFDTLWEYQENISQYDPDRPQDIIFGSYALSFENDNWEIQNRSYISGSDEMNIFLFDENKVSVGDIRWAVANHSTAENKLMISMSGYRDNAYQDIQYPLELTLSRGSQLISQQQYSAWDTSFYLPLASLKQSWIYSLNLRDAAGYSGVYSFHILPDSLSQIKVELGSELMGIGAQTQNYISLLDNFWNKASGELYRAALSLDGDSLVFLDGDSDQTLDLDSFSWELNFTLQANTQPGTSTLEIEIFDILWNSLLTQSRDIRVSQDLQLSSQYSVEQSSSLNAYVWYNSYDIELILRNSDGSIASDYNNLGRVNMAEVYGSLDAWMIPRDRQGNKTKENIYENLELSGTQTLDFISGKAKMTLTTATLAAPQITIDVSTPGMQKLEQIRIDILAGEGALMDITLSQWYISSGDQNQAIAQVQVKDRYGNIRYNDNTTPLVLEIPDQYKNTIQGDNNSKIVAWGTAEFIITSGSKASSSYFKVSAPSTAFSTAIEIPGNDDETVVVSPLNYAIGNIDHVYLWWSDEQAKVSLDNSRRYNGLYSVLLWAAYGDYTQNDYLAGNILFDKNNRSLAVTSVLNNPYAARQLISLHQQAGLQINTNTADIFQDIVVESFVNAQNKLELAIANRSLATHIASVVYTPTNLELIACLTQQDLLGECVSNNQSSISLQSIQDDIISYATNDELVLQHISWERLLSVSADGDFTLYHATSLQARTSDLGNTAIFDIVYEWQTVGHVALSLQDNALNVSRNKTLFENKKTSLTDTTLVYLHGSDYSYNMRQDQQNQVLQIAYEAPIASNFSSLDIFHQGSEHGFETAPQQENIGWEGDNKTLLWFASGSWVWEATRPFMSFSLINLWDPVLALWEQYLAAPLQDIDASQLVRGFDASVWEILDSQSQTRWYGVFDYNGDNKQDIFSVDYRGYITLFENVSGAQRFVNRWELLQIQDMGDPEKVFAWDFSGDGYDDIFFVNQLGQPVLLENTEEEFVRRDLADDFELGTYKIVQAKSFDMDNDGLHDIVSLNNAGEINIHYAQISQETSWNFIKHTVDDSLGISLSTQPHTHGWLVYFNGLKQSSSSALPSVGSLDSAAIDAQNLSSRLIDATLFQDVSYSVNGSSTQQTAEFIQSEYASHLGLSVQKTFSHQGADSLVSGDIIETTLVLSNTSNTTLSGIVYMEQVESLLQFDSESLTAPEWVNTSVIPNLWYDFGLSNITLPAGGNMTFSYRSTLLPVTFGHLDVGYFEHAMIWDDSYGDIVLKSDYKNCGDDFNLYRSIWARDYSIDQASPQCVAPTTLGWDTLAIDQSDADNNGIPDVIDQAKADLIAAGEWVLDGSVQNELFEAVTLDSDGDGIPDIDDNSPWYNPVTSSLGSVHSESQTISEKLDDAIENTCGWFGEGNIGGPLNWAPLAPGSDPTVFWYPVGDGLNIDEWYPVFSSITGKQTSCGSSPCCIPSVHPVSSRGYIPGPVCGPNSAGWSLGVWSPFNTLRVFVTPTLTGAVWVATCFGGPAAVAGLSNAPGVHPLVSGWNCVVRAAPLYEWQSDEPNDVLQWGVNTSRVYRLNTNQLWGFQGLQHWGTPNVANGNIWFAYANCNSTQSFNKNSLQDQLSWDYLDDYLSFRQTAGVNTIMPPTLVSQTGEVLAGTSVVSNGSYTPPSVLTAWSQSGEGNWNFEVSLDPAQVLSGGLDNVVQIENSRVAPFPDFVMDWVTRQVEEIVVKLTDLPTLHVILPSFDHLIDDDWGEFNDALGKISSGGIPQPSFWDIKNAQTFEDATGVTQTQVSGIKEAYSFLSQVPYINLHHEIVNIDIPYPAADMDAIQEHWDATSQQWTEEIEKTKQEWGGIDENNVLVDADALVRTLHKNKAILDSYQDIPQKIHDVLAIKEVWLEQIISGIEDFSEIMGGWIYRNGKTFKSWVEAFLLIKTILTSWQLIIDIFNDYNYQCHDCKNERNDLQYFIWKLISIAIPKIPVITFPKWPDYIIDLHHVRAGINITLPEFNLNWRPITLPRLPELDLPSDPNIQIELPSMPLLPEFQLPTLPRLPEFPSFDLPNLPAAPEIPKIYANFQGVLDILKLILKMMCVFRQVPYVPEWRVGDHIALITERTGFLPSDFIDLRLPDFSLPAFDGNRITSYVNLEYDTDFISQAVDPISDITRSFSNDVVNKIRINTIDTSIWIDGPDDIDIWVDRNGDLDVSQLDNISTLSAFIVQWVMRVSSYMSEQSHLTLAANDFIGKAHQSLSATSAFEWSDQLLAITQSFEDLASYSFESEDLFIETLYEKNSDKFEVLKQILEFEKQHNMQLQKQMKTQIGTTLFQQVSSLWDISRFEAYQQHLSPYQDDFIQAATDLIQPNLNANTQIFQQWEAIVGQIEEQVDRYHNTLIAAVNDGVADEQTNSCEWFSNTSYTGIYVLEEKPESDISYALLHYTQELLWTEQIVRADMDNDGDEDVVYLVEGTLYIKYNRTQASKSSYVSSNPVKVSLRSNQYFNGTDYYEAINYFDEDVISSGFSNISFQAHAAWDITWYRGFFSKTLDADPGHIIDMIPQQQNNLLRDASNGVNGYTMLNNLASLSYAKNLRNVTLKTQELRNLNQDIDAASLINIAANTPIYSGERPVRIEYMTSNDISATLNIPARSHVIFEDKLRIFGLSGDAYVTNNQSIIVQWPDIQWYIGLPLWDDTSIIFNNETLSRDSSAELQISYFDGNTLNISGDTITSYELHRFTNNWDEVRLRSARENAYYYGNIQSFQGDSYSTPAGSSLFAPQASADIFAPELEYNDTIVFSLGVQHRLDISDYIVEDGGLENIAYTEIDMDISVDTNGDGDPSNDPDMSSQNPSVWGEVTQTPRRIELLFGPYTDPLDTDIRVSLTDTSGNTGFQDIALTTQAPQPEIRSYDGSWLTWDIGSPIADIPVTVYRYRQGGLTTLADQQGSDKISTDSGGWFLQSVSPGQSWLTLSSSGTVIADINEYNGDIIPLTLDPVTYDVELSEGFPKITLSKAGEELYYYYPRMSSSNTIQVQDEFQASAPQGMYLNLKSRSFYGHYSIPTSAQKNPWVLVIYRASNTLKQALFTIYPDGRITTLNDYYDIEYVSGSWDIVLRLMDRYFDREVAQLKYVLGEGYILDGALHEFTEIKN